MPPVLQKFTLLELLLVIGILGVLTSLLLPVLVNANHRAQEKHCADNLRQLGIALGSYADAADGAYPYTRGQLSTDSGESDNDAIDRSSMATMVELLDNDLDTLYCPTFWHRSQPGHTGRLHTPYTPGGTLTWGYNKWAGTVNTKPLTARLNYYSRYQDINRLLPAGGGHGATHPGYMSITGVGKAMRRNLVLGNSAGGGLIWQSAYRPKAIVPLMGPGPIPPSEVVSFSDSNNLGKTAISTSHSLVHQDPDNAVVPPVVAGVNELKADGHVTWYDALSGTLYYITDGEPGGAGVFVQDNR